MFPASAARAACRAYGFDGCERCHWLHLNDPIIFWTARDPTLPSQKTLSICAICGSHNRLTLSENCKSFLPFTGASRWPPTTMTKSQARRKCWRSGLRGKCVMSESNWDASRECLRRAKEARYLIDTSTATPTERADLLEVERRLAQKYSLQGAQPSKVLKATMIAG
jgi:hypothetical protein